MPEFKSEKALVLSIQTIGERAFVISVLTKNNGLCRGVFKGKKAPQIADVVFVRWQARLNEQLGTFYLEHLQSIAAPFLDDWKRLCAIKSLCAILNDALPERQSYQKLYEHVFQFLNDLESDSFLQSYLFLELFLLSELGFGLDLSCCAAGGNNQDLIYVSPKTGHAVSREKGLPYRDKLLILPSFFISPVSPTPQDIQQGFALTGYFLEKHALKHHLPIEREFLFKNK